jgi:zinc protease
MKKLPAFRFKSILFFCCFIAYNIANAQYKLPDNIPFAPDVKKGKLNNGLTYYIKHNVKPEKKVELRLVVNAGSVLEEENQLGLAHFMEHMNFNGSKHFPKNELVSYLQSIGVKFGADLNAYTGFDETVYILPIPAEKNEIIEKGFTVLEDWAGGALLTDDEINKERGVVLEELRSGKGAGERMRNKYFPKLLNGSKYAKRIPIGKEELLKSFKPEVLRKFYKDWYRPDLMAVIVVGDIDVAEAEAKIKAHFGSLKNPVAEKPRPSITAILPRQQEEAFSVSDKEGEQTQIEIINYIKPSKDEIVWADYKTNTVKNLFGRMMNQRLQELTQKANPPFLYAYSGFGGFIRGYEAFSSAAITGKGDIKQSVEALITETQRIKKFGFTQAELDRAKIATLNNYEQSLKEEDKTNSSDLLEEYIRNFLEHEPMPGIEAEYAFVKQILPEITITDVNTLTKELEAGQKKFVLITGPEKRDVPVPSNAEILTLVENTSKLGINPYLEKTVATSLINQLTNTGTIVSESKDDALGLTKWTLNNGVTVTVKSTNFKNDEIVLTASRYGGSSLYELKDKYNAGFANSVVTQMGVKDMSPVDLQKYLSGRTVRLNPAISETTEGFNGNSSVKDFETMLQLVYLYAMEPRKDDILFKSFITKQQSLMSGFLQNPNFAFQDTLIKIMSQNHPRVIGIPHSEDLAQIDENRAFEIYKERFSNADGLNFFIIGSVDIEAIKPLIVKYLGSLPGKNTIHEFKDLGVRAPKGVVKFTLKKGKESKSIAVLNFVGETVYDAEENLKLQAAVEVLQIKVIEKLREEMGGVYGASVNGSISKIPYGNYNVSFIIPCGPENVGKLIAATIELINNIKRDGPSEIDLNKVKETWKKKYEEDIKTNTYWSNVLNASEINKTDPKRILTYEKRVDAITADEVKRVAIKYLDLNNYVTAILLPE